MSNPNWPPKEGLIVSCLFPLEEDVLKPGPKPRPALIVEYYDDKTALVVYGTGQKTSVTSGGNDLLESQVEVDPTSPGCRCSNLQEVTRFDFRKAIVLSYTEKWFVPYPGLSRVVIGSFPVCLMSALNNASTYTENLIANKPYLKFGFKKTPPEIIVKGKYKNPGRSVMAEPKVAVPIESENKESTSDTQSAT